VTSVVAVVVTAALLPGSGVGSATAAVRGAQAIPAALAAAIHARLGAWTARSSSAASTVGDPYLGLSVALSANGTTALVGAPGVGGNRGAAYIFHASGAASWSSSGIPVATLTNKHGSAQGLFGYAVALSADGTTAFVGAPLNGTGLLRDGAIYAFHASAENAWASSATPTATLTASHGTSVGRALALSTDGTTLVAGAPFYPTKTLAGGAYVFHVSSEGAWTSTSTPTAILSNSNQSKADLFAGSAVVVSGDGTTALVGDSNDSGGGRAYLFHVSAESAWTTNSTPTAILSDAGSGAHDLLGYGLALSGDGTVALLGALGRSSNTGAVDVFRSSGEASWVSTSTPTATLTKGGSLAGDRVGQNVALSTDGTTAFVLAPGVHSNRGAAFIYHVSGEGAWVSNDAPTATLIVQGAHQKDSLGPGALASDGATALFGAPGARSNTGAAYIYHSTGESSWSVSLTPNATLTNDALAACVVPKVKGLKLSAAKLALAAGRCKLGKVTKVQSAHGKGRVLSQAKKPGTRLAIGAKVAVRVGK